MEIVEAEQILRPNHMRIGVPKEIKTQEFRVGMTPSGVAMLVARGHTVLVEQAPASARRSPTRRTSRPARRSSRRARRSGARDMVVKVKEPIAPEFALMRKDLLLFTYLHLAAAHELGKELLEPRRQRRRVRDDRADAG